MAGNSNLNYLLCQFGMPLYGVAGTPPFGGNYFFVNETTGSDGNTGGPQDPFATLSQAHTACTANNDDVVFFEGTIHQTSSLAWSKNRTHLIGLCSPIRRGKRARISVSGTTAFANLVNVTAAGCWFKDFGTFYGFDSASNNTICWTDSGGRNCYDNVEILGFGNNTAVTGTAKITAARAMLISGSTGENTFRNCVFGVDTTVRTVANYTLEFTGGSPRNHFINCVFEMDAGAATPAHIYTAAADAIDRYCLFDNCVFMNSVKSGATTINQVFNLAATSGGLWQMNNCVSVGATHWETTPSNDIFFNNAAITQSNPGVTLNQTT